MSFREKMGEGLDWIQRFWVVFDIIIALGGRSLVKALLGHVPNIPSDWASVIAWFAAAWILAVCIIVMQRLRKGHLELRQPVSYQTAPATFFPSISALVPGIPKPQFDAQTFFKTAYYSPVTAELEKNILIVANEKEPNNPLGFLSRFIGVGGVATMHDQTWFTIYKSQILMLQDMNRRNGVLPLSDAKTYYDQAVLAYHQLYAKYSFDQWISYLKGQQLILQHPSNMLEITWRGKDFLKYLTHWGRYPDARIG
jgi:hypothetical protein